MRRAVVVIGSSYGDEGKGLASVLEARAKGLPCLNVLINGGAQRGHTVEWRDGRRHVFHHFGSASAMGALSCADEDFIVNPLLFCREAEEMEKIGIRPRLAVSARCRVSLPWDMMLGQIIEENRGSARHGSCGCGIQETRLRYLKSSLTPRFGDLAGLSEAEVTFYCRRMVREYVPARLGELGMHMDGAWREIVESEGLIRRTWEDVRTMLDRAEVYGSWTEIASGYPFILFEAGQGLALDMENKHDFPYLTPSRTTSRVSAERLAVLPGETAAEIMYVTRTYLTRHGPGPFPTECPKERINPDMTDRTNVPNPHQRTLRYGMFDARAVRDRIFSDLEATREVLPGAVPCLTVTHLNETGGELAGDETLDRFTRDFSRVVLSDSPFFD